MRFVPWLAAATIAFVLGADAPSSPSSSSTGGPASAAAAKEQMAKLDWLVGRWAGGGSMQRGPNRSEMRGTELVQRKLDGLTITVEGKFRNNDAPETGPSVHETLGVFYYDDQAQRIRFAAWVADGRRGTYDVEVPSEGTVSWSIPTPQGTIRYTVRRDEAGRWVEVGEMTLTGRPEPVKFFEMTLEKVKE